MPKARRRASSAISSPTAMWRSFSRPVAAAWVSGTPGPSSRVFAMSFSFSQTWVAESRVSGCAFGSNAIRFTSRSSFFRVSSSSRSRSARKPVLGSARARMPASSSRVPSGRAVAEPGTVGPSLGASVGEGGPCSSGSGVTLGSRPDCSSRLRPGVMRPLPARLERAWAQVRSEMPGRAIAASVIEALGCCKNQAVALASFAALMPAILQSPCSGGKWGNPPNLVA